MAAEALQTGAPFRAETEERFFEAYRWCLDPMLSLRDVLQHLAREIESYRANGAAGWQGEEHRINLYLFACAVACTLDDDLAARPSEAALAAAWRRQWTGCVDAACELLLGASDARFCERARPLLAAAPGALGESAQRRRMRIPEAFRCQDLTHQDVLAMVRLCLPALPEKDRPVAVVGPRTAGAYFAPLAAARLRALGYARVTWHTVRPKEGLSRAESRGLSTALRSNARVLIVDDHPNSGHTLRLMLRALRGLGAAPADTVVALPGHPCVPGWTVADEVARGVRLCMLAPEDRYKARLLDSARSAGSGSDTAALNREFAARYADGFQVRLKSVLESAAGRVMAKSVGWGWLGYHAWLAGTALEGFVPRPLCLRDGILYSEYIGSPSEAHAEASAAAQAETAAAEAEAAGAYVARRVNALPLGEDPAFATPGYRWCGWDDLVAVLSRVYGPYVGRLKKRAIRRALRPYVAPSPTLVDGSMKPVDWVRSGRKLLKTDYEHHNFGGGEADVVDPAWDLASAVFEFQFSPEAERRLLQAYGARTSDPSVEARLPLYKILYATSALRAAQYWLARQPNGARREDWNRRLVAARSFAAVHLARYCGRTLGAAPLAWERRLCFLALNGVLECAPMGFPHATPCALRALQLLRRNGFSVVLNTARSLEQVREYCRAYRLPGGVAELGGVFWDAIREREVPLIDPEAVAQIESLRKEIEKLPGVFLDPQHRYSIRAYRFEDGCTRPLRGGEAAALLERGGRDRLSVVESGADTTIVGKGAGKGPALAGVRAYLGCSGELVAAIGASSQDVEMLRAADLAYAPADASREVRGLIVRGACRRTSRPRQAGLLEAAMKLCLAAGRIPNAAFPRGDGAPRLLDELLQVPDRRPVERMFSALRWRRL